MIAGNREKSGRSKPGAKTEGPAKVGRKNLAAVFIAATEEEKKAGKTGQIVEFSDQEAVVLKTFLATGSYEEAAVEAGGITIDSVKRMLRRPNLKRYLNEIITKAALVEGTDKPWFTKEMRRVWEGEVKPTREMMDAAKLIEKVVNPRGPGVVINNQQNSIYGSMNREAVDAEWADARATSAEGV